MSAIQDINGTGQAVVPAEIINLNTPVLSGRVETVEANFFEKAVCLSLTIGRFGNTRKAPLSSVEVRADKRRLRLSKQLLVSPELDKSEGYDMLIRSPPPDVPLRAGDAIHTATALETEIWTNDRHLLAAVAHFGLAGRSA